MQSMADAPTTFKYPPLPAGVDAIRILNVEPGDFSDPLICTLTSVAFSTKPKYAALSYTWGNPYPDSFNISIPSKLPTQNGLVPLTLNDQLFYVAPNLYLALLHLRSPTLPLSLWVDAICVHQMDMEERNAQVSMMSFIYRRAMKVVAWLGTREYRNSSNSFSGLSIANKAGQVQHFAASLSTTTKLRCSGQPDQSTLARIAESSYWTRLWIVQELCLPRLVVFVYESSIWTYDDFRPMLDIRIAKANDGYNAMLRLLETRDARHTATMTLESLIERFAKSRCGELRDRVYGLLGLAKDVVPLSMLNGSTSVVEEYIAKLDMQQGDLPEPQRGIGSIRVDYSRPFYEIWTDVVKFLLFRAKTVERWTEITRNGAFLSFKIDDGVFSRERRVSVVRAAAILQEAFDQKVEEELAIQDSFKQIPMKPVIRAIGYLSGEILQLGPSYESLAASFKAHQDWVGSWENYYHRPVDFQNLWKIEEEYTSKIMSYEARDLARIREIRNDNIVAWHAVRKRKPKISDPAHLAECEKMWERIADDANQNQPKGSKICLGTNYTIALVPSATKIGDVIVQFWGCNAAIVMRPVIKPWTSDLTTIKGVTITEGGSPHFILVGRADIADLLDAKSASMCCSRGIGSKEGCQNWGAVYIDLDFRTLQLITASTTTW